MKVLAFDVLGDFGHFRKFYTTSSPLTFSVIPPTAAYGLLGAILGITNENNHYLNVLNARTVRLAVQLLRPVRKTMIGVNHINTKAGFWPLRASSNPRTQIRMEVLQEPGFRLYVHLKDPDLFQRLCSMIRNHETVYTPCLGLSGMLADIRYYAEGELIAATEKREIDVHTIIPATKINQHSIRLEPGLKLLKEKMPVQMNTEREVDPYEFFIFDHSGKSVGMQITGIYKFDYDNTGVVFCNGEA